MRKKLSRYNKFILISVGSLSVGLGVIGIFIPLLPTTPFLLLASACYFRSSEKHYQWLLSNRLFGSYIKNYQEGKGVPFKLKIFIILLLWLTIGYSVFFIVSSLLLKAVLIIIAIAVTIHIFIIKTYKKRKK